MKTPTKLLSVFILIYLFNSSFVFTQDWTQLKSQSATTVDTAWVNRFMSNSLPGKIQIYDMITDASDNVYMVGSVRNMLSGEDFITIKYNSDGVEQWSAEFNGPRNSRDVGTGIAVDASGNVYVTGSSNTIDTKRDYATIKYNSEGEQQWVAYYDGPILEDYDDAYDIAVDDEGNIYVTGETETNSGYDITTIKYNTSGEEQWVEHYDGPASESDDTGYFIEIDISGNIYVAGRSDDNDGKNDYLIIKYNSSGEEQWVARYNGPDKKNDNIAGIEVDELGNVYATGQSSNADFKWEYATVMFNSAGVEQWSSRYSNSNKSNNYARSLAVSDSGYVYITGSSSVSGSASGDDFITIKYSPAGAEEWVKIYNGPSDTYDKAQAINLDDTENIYVSGQSEGTTLIKYDKAGNELLTANYPESYGLVAQSMDVSGNIIFAGNHGSGYCGIVKLTQAGMVAWDNIKHGPPLSNESPVAMALDLSGNLFVAGISSGDYSLIKYNSNGDELWAKFYSGPDNSYDKVTAITTDNAGNIYLTGQSGPAGSDKNWATIKYNAEGEEQWAAIFLGIADYISSAEDIVADANGNVYVTGYSPKDLSFSSIDITTIKYTSAGEEEWVVYYDGPAADQDEARAITIDPSGNIYVTGYSKGLTSGEDFVTIKYNPAGAEQWVSHYNGDGDAVDIAIDIDIDHLNNIVICGSSSGSGTNLDFATVQYNSSGEEQWVQRFDGTRNQRDEPKEIAVSGNGDVFVTGFTSGTNDYDYLTIKYSIDGLQQWASEYNGPGYNFSNYDEAYALAIGESGNVYVTGVSEGFYGSYDYATLKYNSEGIVEWETRYDFKYDSPVDVVSDGLGNVYVSGRTVFDNDSEAMAVTIKYTDESVTGTDKENNNLPGTFQLSQNYPNPFNQTTNISWNIKQNSFISLKVYNILGQEIATLVNGMKSAGTHTVSFNAEDLSSGVYLYKLETNEFSQTRKMLLYK